MSLVKKIASTIMISSLFVISANASDSQLIKEGENIFNSKKLGNCLACHNANGKKIDGPGSMGPMLQYLSAWPEQALYDKIYDPYTTNPISAMPAFGKNGWLSDAQIKAVVAYLKTIK